MGTSVGVEAKIAPKMAAWRLPSWWPTRSWWWPESGARNPIPALDGVRTLAVLLVMFFHAWWVTPERIALGADALTQPVYYLWTGVHLSSFSAVFCSFCSFCPMRAGFRVGVIAPRRVSSTNDASCASSLPTGRAS